MDAGQFEEAIKLAALGAKTSCLVKYNDQLWWKSEQPQGGPERHVLATVLGRGWLNIAEAVVPPSGSIVTQYGDGSVVVSGFSQPLLVRIGTTYCPDELPIKNLDEAAAADIVFSLWVRRRDTGPQNRVYTKGGIPVWFDFGIAFGNELHHNVTLGGLGEPKTFFRSDGGTGYMPALRVVTIPQGVMMTREMAERWGGADLAPHFIYDRDAFDRHLAGYVDQVKRFHEPLIRDAVFEAGWQGQEAEDVVSMLRRSQGELDRCLATLAPLLNQTIDFWQRMGSVDAAENA